MVECLHQPLQTDPVSLIPLFGNPGSALPNAVSIHLFGSTERRLKRLPSRDTLVHIVVCVHPSQGIIGETPFAGIEAIPLVNEGCGVSLLSPRAFEKIACRPSLLHVHLSRTRTGAKSLRLPTPCNSSRGK